MIFPSVDKDFIWVRDVSGYRITDEIVPEKPQQQYGPKRPRYIIPINPSRDPSSLIYYSNRDIESDKPDYPLFGRFSRLESEGDIISFANRWGLLTNGENFRTNQSNQLQLGYSGESLKFWQENIRIIEYASALLKWQQDGDIASIEDATDWSNPGIFSFKFKRRLYAVASAYKHADVFELLCDRKDDPMLRLRAALLKIINDSLDQYPVRPRLYLVSNNPDDKNLPVLLEPRTTPTSLIGWMWWEIYLHSVGNRYFKQCPKCEDWFDLTFNKKRNEWKTCATCGSFIRQQRFKARQKEAVK